MVDFNDHILDCSLPLQNDIDKDNICIISTLKLVPLLAATSSTTPTLLSTPQHSKPKKMCPPHRSSRPQ